MWSPQNTAFDHIFDHLQIRTTWKQCFEEHPKAPSSDTKPLKSPEITQKIFAGHFGTLRLQDRIFFPKKPQKSLETSGLLFIRTKSEY